MSQPEPTYSAQQIANGIFETIHENRRHIKMSHAKRRELGAGRCNSLLDLLLQGVKDEPHQRSLPPRLVAATSVLSQTIARTPDVLTSIHSNECVIFKCSDPDLREPLSMVLEFVLGIHSEDDGQLAHGDVMMIQEASGKFERSNMKSRAEELIARGGAIVGIAGNPKRELPACLQQLATWTINMARVDAETISLFSKELIGEAVCDLDPEIVSKMVTSDLVLAFRQGVTTEDYAERLKTLVNRRLNIDYDGPTVESLHGYGHARHWGLALQADLASYMNGKLNWAEIDNGAAILAGPPGTGKTSFARSLSKSLNIPVIASSVAEWLAEDHLGQTLSAMEKTFADAQVAAPCILFIDEIDGIGSRQNLNSRHREYWMQLINRLLELVDGFASMEGVVLLAATNHPSAIDPALTRAGRFDRVIDIDLPDTPDLAAIYRQYLGDELPDIDLRKLASQTAGKTGADVKGYVARAKGHARREDRALSINDLECAVAEDVLEMPLDVIRRVAIHEAGHVIAMHERGLLASTVGIRSDGGFTNLQKSCQEPLTTSQVETLLVELAAGGAAEEVCFGDIALVDAEDKNSDLARSLELVRSYSSNLCRLSTTELTNEADSTEKTAVRARQFGAGMLLEASKKAHALIIHRRDDVERLAALLVEKRFLTSQDLKEFFADPPAKSENLEAA